jgi:hypothetical protein
MMAGGLLLVLVKEEDKSMSIMPSPAFIQL